MFAVNLRSEEFAAKMADVFYPQVQEECMSY